MLNYIMNICLVIIYHENCAVFSYDMLDFAINIFIIYTLDQQFNVYMTKLFL